MTARGIISTLVEDKSDPLLLPSDIYNFYFLWLVSTRAPEALQTQYGSYISSTFLDSIREKYIETFSHLIKDQLLKYASLRRVDQEFDASRINSATPGDLLSMMKQTRRSDMRRRNERWELIAEHTKKLAESTNRQDIFLCVDQLNSCVHNTDSPVIEKFSNGDELMHALVQCQNITSIRQYYRLVSIDLRELTALV